MGLWVHALCTVSVLDALGDVQSFFDSLDLAELEIEVGGVPGFDPLQTRNALAIETGSPLPPPYDTVCFALTYGDGDSDGFSWDRYADPDRVRDEAADFRYRVPAGLSQNSEARIFRVLDSLLEIVSTRLPDSSTDGLMWPLARETAFWLARKGKGLVVLENDWFDPDDGSQLK